MISIINRFRIIGIIGIIDNISTIIDSTSARINSIDAIINIMVIIGV